MSITPYHYFFVTIVAKCTQVMAAACVMHNIARREAVPQLEWENINIHIDVGQQQNEGPNEGRLHVHVVRDLVANQLLCPGNKIF